MEPNYLKLRKNELLILLLVFAVVFTVRFHFRQISLWDWDETLFASSIHKYDLTIHSPHPPGYFVLVVLLRLAYKIFGDEATTQIFLNVFFGSLAVFPLYHIFRQAASAPLALAGVLIYISNPTVWADGESGFSDTTAFFWFVLALAVLMRAEKNRYFYGGCFLLAVAMGIRPQNMLLGGFALIALWRKLRERDFKAAITGVALFGFTCLAWLIPTMIYGAGGIRNYIAMVTAISSTFSVENSNVLGAMTLSQAKGALREMLISIWGNWYLGIAVNLLTVIGLIAYLARKKWWELLVISVCFFPYFVFTFLALDLNYLKYTIPYIPFFAFFAAAGVYELASIGGRIRKPAFAVGTALILLFCTVGAYPAVKILHGEKSPVVQAIDYIQNHLSPEKDMIYYDAEFYTFARLYLKKFKIEATSYYRTGDVLPQPGMDVYVLTPFNPERGSPWNINFKRLSPALSILGARYQGYFFNVWLNKTDIVYVDFAPRPERTSFWTREKSMCYLRNDGENKVLSIKGHVPVSLFQQTPVIAISLNDQLLEEFPQESEELLKAYSIPGDGLKASTWSKLEIKIDQTFDPANSEFVGEADGNVGFILQDLTWTDAGAAVAAAPPAAEEGTPSAAGTHLAPSETNR